MGESAIICMKNIILLQNVKAGLMQIGFSQVIETDNLENLLRQRHTLKKALVIFDPSEYGTNGIRVSKALVRENMGPLIFIISNKRLVKPIEEITETDGWVATYITTPFNFEVFRVTVRIVLMSYRKITDLERKIQDVNEKLLENKKVNKAKELLIKNKQLKESDAHRLIQKISMNSGKSMRVVAEKIIREFSF